MSGILPKNIDAGTCDSAVTMSALTVTGGTIGGTALASVNTKKSKFDATAAPSAATDDTTLGYDVGSLWADVTADKVYICVDATDGAAVWLNVGSTGESGVDVTLVTTAANYLSIAGQAITLNKIDLDETNMTASGGITISTNDVLTTGQLNDLATMANTDGNFIVGNGSGFSSEVPATARASLGVAIGSDVQQYHANLDGIRSLGDTSTDGEFLVATGVNTFAWEDGDTARTSLGVGTGNNVTFTDGTFTGDVQIDGDLTMSGESSTTTLESSTVVVDDSLIKLGKDNIASNGVDLGAYAPYSIDAGTTVKFAGYHWDATDSKFKFFSATGNSHEEPTTTVNTTAGYTLADMEFETVVATTFTGALTGNADTATNATNSTNATNGTNWTGATVASSAGTAAGSIIVSTGSGFANHATAQHEIVNNPAGSGVTGTAIGTNSFFSRIGSGNLASQSLSDNTVLGMFNGGDLTSVSGANMRGYMGLRMRQAGFTLTSAQATGTADTEGFVALGSAPGNVGDVIVWKVGGGPQKNEDVLSTNPDFRMGTAGAGSTAAKRVYLANSGDAQTTEPENATHTDNIGGSFAANDEIIVLWQGNDG